MRKLFFIFVLSIIGYGLQAQIEDETILTIGKKKINAGEFEYMYKKNNQSDMNKKSPEEYMDLFINYNLKVAEAERLKMDTLKSFRNEFSGYQKQIAKPYLSEKAKIKQLIREAYERNQTDVKLDIIFIKIKPNPSPKDTLKAYQKASSVRDELTAGTPWDSVALKYSDDRRAARNKGHLPFITGGSIPYQLQNYIFKVRKDKISPPLRTKHGYYIIRKVDQRPNPGTVKVAHIMQTIPKSMSDEDKKAKKERIDSIYDALKNGAEFAELVKLSDDQSSSKNGGELRPFSTGKMVPEFEKAAFALQQAGDFSKPIRTDFGWHIIKLISREKNKSFEEVKEDLQKQIERDPKRRELIENYVSYKLKKEFNFKEKNKPVKFHNLLDSTVFQANWELPDTDALTQTLFVVNGKEYTEADFAHFIVNNQKRSRKSDISDYVDEIYNQYITFVLTETEIEQLAESNPEFKYLSKEYHNGLLLFDLMEKEVWSKAAEDSIGLRKFYENRKKQYAAQPEVEIAVYSYDNPKFVKKLKKAYRKNKNMSAEDLAKEISNNEKRFNFEQSGKYMHGQNKYADMIIDKINAGEKFRSGDYMEISRENKVILVRDVSKGKNKKFEEIKGTVISDYQNHLEKEWLEDLKKRHKVKINEKVFNKIKTGLK